MNYRETMSRLNAALNNIDTAYAIVAKQHGLTYNALMMIYLMEEVEHITQKQVCDALHLPKSTVHSMVLDLIKQGYVSLDAGSNKKEKYIVVTTQGKPYFDKIYQETKRFEANALSALGDDACELLAQTAQMLGSILIKELESVYGGEVQ